MNLNQVISLLAVLAFIIGLALLALGFVIPTCIIFIVGGILLVGNEIDLQRKTF